MFNYIYINYETYKIKLNCLLILGKAPSHFSDLILDFLDDKNIKRIFIPGELTRKLQALDLSINKPFKENFKKKFNQYLIEQGEKGNTIFHNHHAKVDRKLNVEWIQDVLKKDINSEIIANGFKK